MIPSTAMPLQALTRRFTAFVLFGALSLLAACSDASGPSVTDQPEPHLLFLSTRDGALDALGRPMKEIYRISLDGTGAENLTGHPAFIYADLSLAPDGRALAFVRECDIFVLNAHGSDVRQLTNRDGGSEDACNGRTRWSHDGTRIAFTSKRDGELVEISPGYWTIPSHVYVMDANGDNARRLTGEMEGTELGDVVVLGWSPAGEVVFQTSRSSADGWERRVYVVGTDGEDLRPLFDRAGDITPAWSPDGSRVVFIREADGVQRLHMMNPDGSGERPLTSHAGEDRLPGHTGGTSPVGVDYDPWSPDGSRLAFERNADGKWGIYLMDSDGSNLRRLTDRAGDQFNGWSPDGEWIAFTRSVNTSSAATLATDVFIVRADGTGLVNVTDNPARDSDAIWVPGL